MSASTASVEIAIPMIVAAMLSLLLTPVVRKVAQGRGWFDDANDPRKIHRGSIPRLGGVAVFIALVAGMAGAYWAGLSSQGPAIIVPLFGAAIMWAVGLVDDFKSLRARFKFGIQTLVAIAVTAAGFRFEQLPLPGGMLSLGLGSWPLTVIWIVGISNAINMIDGMDGLAGGIGLIAALGLGALSLSSGEGTSSALAFALAGAITGFLFFNLPPARIFMGDSGSLLIGYSLSILPLIAGMGHPRHFSVLAAGTIVAVPVFDVFAAILRRRRRGQRVMEPDKEHIHHKLLGFGLDTRVILAIVYSVCIGLGGAAIGAAGLGSEGQFWVLVGTLALLGAAFIVLHFVKEKGLGREGHEDVVET